MRPHTHFSFSSFVATGFLHAVATAGLAFLAVFSGMAAFPTSDDQEGNWLFWLWITPTMLVWEASGRSAGDGLLLSISLIWSLAVGVAGGFILPWMFPRIIKQDPGYYSGHEDETLAWEPQTERKQPGDRGKPDFNHPGCGSIIAFQLALLAITVLVITLDTPKTRGSGLLWWLLCLTALMSFIAHRHHVEEKRGANPSSFMETLRFILICVFHYFGATILLGILLLLVFLMLV